jgi:acetylornithine deacetylase/succinyl-diaminopimelate desuccinylase-like protein
VLAPLQKLVDEMMAENPQLKAKVSFARGEERCYTGEKIAEKRFFPGWVFDKNADYVTSIVAELKRMGFSPEIGVFNFCTNGSHYAGEAGIKTIGLGPSLETLAHTIDEYIEIGELTKITESYYGVMKALLK